MKSQFKAYVKIYFYIYIAVLVLTFLVTCVINYLQSSQPNTAILIDFSVKNIIDSALFAVSPALVVMGIFNKYLWHFKIIKGLLSIDVPFIEGRWEGYILSTYTQHKKKHTIAIEFSQSLTGLHVWYYDGNAITHSMISDIILDADGGPPRVLCIYDNNPIVNRDTGLTRHIGVMEMFVLANEDKIEGTYFNNPVQKNTYGEIHISFVSRKRKKSFQ